MSGHNGQFLGWADTDQEWLRKRRKEVRKGGGKEGERLTQAIGMLRSGWRCLGSGEKAGREDIARR